MERQEMLEIVRRAWEAVGTDLVAAGSRGVGRFDTFQDIMSHDCSSCDEYNKVADAVFVSAANEHGGFSSVCAIMGCSDEANETAHALRDLFDALDWIEIELSRNHLSVVPDDPLHPNGKCRCCGEGTCEWCQKYNEE